MRISIVGKGTSAIVTALKCIQYGHEVTIFYDPNQPHVRVGESTTPIVSQLVYDVLGLSIHYLSELGIYSIKSGVKFINWGEGKSFYHHFANNNVACHLDSGDFNEFINNFLESNRLVTYVPKLVKEYEVQGDSVIIGDLVFDHIIFCSGWSNDSDYYSPMFESVNSAFLFKKDEIEEPHHTLHEATEHGWQFGIPFISKNIVKHGYLFNRNIDDVRRIEEKFPHSAYIEWIPRYAKNILQNRHCSYNGNRLFFIEPLQALSLHYYIVFAEFICEYLKERNEFNLANTNVKYHAYMWSYQVALSYHYNYGSVFKSSFWNRTKELSSSIMSRINNGNDEIFRTNLYNDLKFRQTDYSKIGTFSFKDHIQLYCGMKNISLNQLFTEII